MRKIFALQLSLVLVALIAGFARAETNQVKNPGFEDGAGPRGIPNGGWWLYQSEGFPEVSLDTKQAHEGKASVKLSAGKPARFTLVSSPFTVAPADEIRFEGFARAQALQGEQNPFILGLAFRDAAGTVIDRSYTSPQSPVGGSWTHLTGTTKAPEQAVSAEIHLQFNRATGSAWIDDLSASITNLLSLSIAVNAKPYVGDQKITALVVNRGSSRFAGKVRITLGKTTSEAPVDIEPGREQRAELPITTKTVGPQSYTLELLDSSGVTQRALAGKFQTLAPLAVYPACPCYHATGDGDGTTRVDAQINLDPKRKSGCRLELNLTDSVGKVLDSATEDASEGDLVGHAFKVPVGSTGDFLVTIRLLDADKNEIAKGQADVHVRPPADSQVLMGSDGFPRIGGMPHFPLGLYSSGRFPEMGEAGFSFTHSYQISSGEATLPIIPADIRLKELLDRSYDAGMKMMVELPRQAIDKAEWAQIRRRIETFRHHPGLGYWGSEERVARGGAPLKNIASLYRIVKELDPDHPFVLGDTRDVIGHLMTDRRSFFPVDLMDVGIWWWYPIPPKPTSGEGKHQDYTLEPPSWLTGYSGNKPLWIAVQCYKHPRIDARYPTPTEYRLMCYLSIIHGVKGLAFYTGSGQLDYYKKPSGILNNPEEGNWEYVRKLIRELRDLDPVLTSPTLSGAVKKEPADSSVDFVVKENAGKLYILAANRTNAKRKVSFRGDILKGRRGSVHTESRATAVRGDSLSDTFGPFATHVYVLE